MIINSLTLENFKSHKNTKIDFNNNISLILGNNGAGKSSILEAISFALFKKFEGKNDEIKRKPIDENDNVKKTSVTLKFNHNNTHYLLTRGLNSKTELRYKENDSYFLKSSGDKNVTNDIKSILELDEKSFLNAIYIKQGEITELIESKPAERKELITKLLDIDSFEKAYKEIKNLIDLYKDELKEKDIKLGKKDEINDEINSIENIILEKTKNLEGLKPENEELEKTVLRLESEIKQLELNKAKYETSVKSLKFNRELLEKCEKQKEINENKLSELENNEKNIQIIEKEIKPLDHLKELKTEKVQLDKINEQLKQTNNEINEINKNIEKRDSNKQAHEKLNEITNEIEKLNNDRKKISDEYLKYNSIQTKISEKEDKLKILRNEIGNASSDATKILNEYFTSPESIEKKVNEETEKTNQFIENLTKQINENKTRIGILDTELKTTKKSLKDLNDTEDICPICQSEINHDKHEELSRQYNEKITNNELEKEDLINSNENQNAKLKELKEYLSEIQKISIDVLKEKDREFSNLSDEIKELKSKIPEEYNNEDQLNEIDEKLETYEKEQNNLKKFSENYIIAINRLRELSNIEELLEKQEELNKENKNVKAKCQDIVKRFGVKDDLDRQIKYLESKKDKLNNLKGSVENKNDIINNINNITEEINTYTKNIAEIDEEIKNLNYNTEDYENKERIYRQNKSEFEENKTTITKIETEITKDKENIENRQKELKELEIIEEEQKNLKDYIKILETFREIYSKDGVQKDLRKNVKPLIEKETSDIFNEFDFDYSNITLDSDYNITLHNKNEELTLNMISGGEKIVIALALRLGIAKVLSKNSTDMLILDEPTIHLDENRRSSLIDIISQIKFVPQMIIVTHDEEMEALSNNIIKVRKENGISYVDNS